MAFQRYHSLLPSFLIHWKSWALILGITLASSFTSLLQPWPLKILVDHVLGSLPLQPFFHRLVSPLPGMESKQVLLAWMVGGGLFLFLLTSLWEILLNHAWIKGGQQMVYDLAARLLDHLQQQSLLFHTRNSVGDLMSRIMGDSWCLNTLVNTLLITPIHSLLVIAGTVVVMANMDLPLTLVSLIIAPIMAIGTWFLGKPIFNAAKSRRGSESRLQSHLLQVLTGIPVVQAYNQQQREENRFQEYASQALEAQQKSTLLNSLLQFILGLFSTLGLSAVLWFGAHRILDHKLTLGGFLVFLAYLTSVQHHLKSFFNLSNIYQNARASMERVLEILESNQSLPVAKNAPPLNSVKGRIQFEHVTFGFEIDRPILNDISLVIEPGQKIAIVGPTGAGKSTLIQLIPRFLDPWTGTVSIDGNSLREVTLESVRCHVSMVFQDPHLLPCSIADNIRLGKPNATKEEIEAAAKAAQADAFIQSLDQGYETLLAERGANLSGGERQRLSLARAFLKNAPILILDEPTSALDSSTEQSLTEAINRLTRNRTTVVVAHRISTIQDADLILFMRDGKIVEQGTYQDLVNRKGEFTRFHELSQG